MNNTKVFTLLAAMTALFGLVGNSIGGQNGAVLALLIAGAMNFIMYFNSSKMVLRSYRAQVVKPTAASELYATVDRLRQRAGLPMPTVAIAPHQQPNAFATGRNPAHAVVCVTQGLLDLVNQDELEGVLAHELGHIKNRDMLLQTISATMAGAIGNLARFGMYAGGRRRSPLGPLAAMLAPFAAMIIQFAISRQREYKADAVGAEISGKPLALASALEKLQKGARLIPMNVSPSVAPLAQVNPLSAFGGLAKLFSTHPPTEERIARLRAMAEPGSSRQLAS
ncbi:MAG: zinc metalloprotease HtpX [Gammaproteobacteria bacterium]|nr:zinc metalloprotease HtpX [Gammaproteobacteria bacterium]